MKETVNANIQLNLYGKPVELNLSLPAEPVKPLRMLPVLQQITNKFVDTAIEAFMAADEEISCQAGCGACCRQPVPLSEPEVFQIAELVENLPELRRTAVKQKFADACQQLEKIDWFGRLDKVFTESSASKKEAIRNLALEYFTQQIACPFLENESCSIHPDRPLSCREFLVTSPAENCSHPTPENIKHVELKFKVSDIVRQFWKTENLPHASFVTMIYALEWVRQHSDKFSEKTGGDWLGEFFGQLQKG